MVSYNRKLLSPSPATSPYPSSDGLSCQLVENCSSDGSVSCFECFPSYLPSPQPQPSVRQNSLQNHIVPYLITIVCVLGVAFLILSTCTVLLRHRWNRRRRNSRRVTDFTSPDDGFYDGHDGPGSIDHPIWHITTIGLQQSVIDSITAFKYHKYQGLSIDGGDCSVCLTEFEDGDDLRLLPKCSHAFHMPCIDTWLRSHTNCPLCRAPIVDEVSGGGSCGGTSSSSDSVSHEVGPQSQRMEDVHSNSGSSDHRRGRSGRHNGESSFQIRHRDVDPGVLPVEGITMDEIVKKQREHLRVCSDFAGLQMEGMKMDEVLKKQSEDLRVRSDLGDIHYRAWMGEDFEPIRRSLSFDLSLDLRSMKGEGTSSSKQGKGVDSGKDAAGKQQLQLQDDDDDGRNESISFESMKNPSIGRLLQKGPVSMRRSISSSSGKFFSSFRKSKSQATVLPL